MASLPADRTKLALAQGNQVPSAVASSTKNINATTEAYDTIDLLNAKVDTHAAAATLPHADGSVVTSKLANLGVTTPKIAPLAITSDKIAIGAVGVAQLSPASAVNETVNNALIVALSADVTQRGVNVNVAPYTADNSGVADSTTTMQSALDNNKIVIFPEGTFLISSLTVPEGRIILTAGIKTILQQKVGTASGTSILNISNSNVIVNKMSYIGNIATDTAEQRHAVHIGNDTAVVSNVDVRGISASNIRGDGLYIGAALGYAPKDIRILDVSGTNLYRNGISITSGDNISIDGVDIEQVGLIGIDIESNSDYIRNVKISNVKTAGVFVGGYATNVAENIKITNAEINGLYRGSTPSYPTTTTQDDGIVVRNAHNVTYEKGYVHDWGRFGVQTIKSGGDVDVTGLLFKGCKFSSCMLTDATYTEYAQVGSALNPTFEQCEFISTSKTKAGIYGASSGGVRTPIHCNDCIFTDFSAVVGYGKVMMDNCSATGYANWGVSLVAGGEIKNCVGSGDKILSNCATTILIGNEFTYTVFNFTSNSYHAEFNNVYNGARQTRRITTLSAIPTTGTWAVGDTIEVQNNSVGAPWLYICTSAGTPGTWKEAGYIHNKLHRENVNAPTSGTFSVGDVYDNTAPTLVKNIDRWKCIVAGTPGTWRAYGIGQGTTANRPALVANDAGYQYLDTTLAANGKLITWTGTIWVDYSGASV